MKIPRSEFLKRLAKAGRTYRSDMASTATNANIGVAAQEAELPTMTPGLSLAILALGSETSMDAIGMALMLAEIEKAWEEYLALPEEAGTA